jgi:cytoskeletal protein RodZ
MPADNNIQSFTVADIEKYHKGLLSNTEMHDLEKAALDDPFLADALEGYAVPGILAADLAELKKRLAEKVEEDESGVIVMKGSRRTGFPWFRAAAAVVIIAGAGLLANQFLFTKQKNEIAQLNKETANPAAPAEPGINDSAKTSADIKEKDKTAEEKTPSGTAPVTNGPVSNTLPSDRKTVTAPGGNAGNKWADATDNKTDKLIGEVTTVTKPAPVVTEASKTAGGKLEDGVVTGKIESKDVASIEELKNKAKRQTNNDADAAGSKERGIVQPEYNIKTQQDKNVAFNRKADEQNYRFQNTNIFRGRITDANNVGVPYANVTNLEDKAGTYSDANGYFNLTSPDTVLTVQVRSIGFENNQVELRNNVPANKVVLQDDRRSLSEVVISSQKPNAAARNRDANKTLEEPEPSDGWDNYDTYLVNNLNVPDDIKTKQNNAGSVRVSFEVDKNGEPVNMRVEKSLCGKCDKEAIRLIKDGPKWKRTANKKGRTTVTINF